MLLNDVKPTFDYRHDFEGEDIQTIKERWPNVTFHNIPLAWIIPIDEMLCRLRYDNPIYEVRQEFGHLVVLSVPLNSNQKRIIQQAEDEIYLIDVDLHMFLDNSAIDIETLD